MATQIWLIMIQYFNFGSKQVLIMTILIDFIMLNETCDRGVALWSNLLLVRNRTTTTDPLSGRVNGYLCSLTLIFNSIFITVFDCRRKLIHILIAWSSHHVAAVLVVVALFCTTIRRGTLALTFNNQFFLFSFAFRFNPTTLHWFLIW